MLSTTATSSSREHDVLDTTHAGPDRLAVPLLSAHGLGVPTPLDPPPAPMAEDVLGAAVPLSPLATAAPRRAVQDPRLTATNRRRDLRLELVLVVRRAERGPTAAHPAPPHDRAIGG